MNSQEQGFCGLRVLVSGASSGIGRQIALELIQKGAHTILLGRRKEKLEETAQLSCAPDRAEVCVLDLTRLEDIGPAIGDLAGRLGRLYGLCHCAGVVQTLPLAASKPERVRAMLDLNFMAGLELARAITRRDILSETGGSILWIASIYAHVGAPGQIGYCASKGAITAAVRAMALELASRKVRVNSISPGMVSTDMTDAAASRMSKEQWAHIAALHPLGPGEPRDVARAAAFLLDPDNRWITGADLIIDGGFTLQ
ncbi:SDR family NAD(P)-dependent oxidoreductase [Thiocapsa marina]|uniref:3-oxoacyl-(Acyl-carrier-protein) reductase n=1 Tax=Thiocapsa marina 5811 TaxID=768671 RepID=F9UAT9_9GAMM|nr:SDR family oxidoreductase [Thiocapsa marina]EGV18557.1 3-oxoacyl-(acyl-carrier-protein) reductase [Thiocapsa marina 5811]